MPVCMGPAVDGRFGAGCRQRMQWIFRPPAHEIETLSLMRDMADGLHVGIWRCQTSHVTLRFFERFNTPKPPTQTCPCCVPLKCQRGSSASSNRRPKPGAGEHLKRCGSRFHSSRTQHTRFLQQRKEKAAKRLLHSCPGHPDPQEVQNTDGI